MQFVSVPHIIDECDTLLDDAERLVDALRARLETIKRAAAAQPYLRPEIAAWEDEGGALADGPHFRH